ncbi:MAG: medium chain dehydrogenase/reductase family protein [bacterium]|nr:medium chain dehydrogenase/reductase family protein [bacterium]
MRHSLRMQQVYITKNGGYDVLQARDSDDPRPGPGEVRIAVKASGVNFADIMARQGLYPDAPPKPCVVGYEVSGVVDALGSPIAAGTELHKNQDQAPALNIGDRVFAITRFGGYASRVCVPAMQVFPMPAQMSFEEAAAIPVNYFTAYLGMFFQGNLKAGESFLIHSAGGGVGLAAIHLAQTISDVQIFGTASSGKHAFLQDLGVQHLIDYRTQDFEAEIARRTNGRGVDLILDAVGGDSFMKGYRSLAPLGRLVMFGMSTVSGANIFRVLKTFLTLPKFKPMSLLDQNKGVFGLNLGHLWDEIPRLRGIGLELIDLYTAGKIKPYISKTFSLAEAGQAHRFIQERKNTGKVLLLVD